jgi:predicted SAM-dependent methyltransferase
MNPARKIKKAIHGVISHVQNPGKIRKILSRKDQPVKLHIGSGRNYKEGWVNIDFDPKTRKDILYNLSKGIPFPDNSVDFIYNEHFIEHLTYDEGFAFMQEAYRALKPGGVLRIACPDLDFLMEGYIKDSWRSQEWVRLIKAYWYPGRCYMFNQNMREDGGHQYMYNHEELAARLNEAGFFSHHIRAEKVNHSTHKELQNIERRADSMVVEAKKERSFAASPLLTVIVPAYNNETSIAKALESILEQKTSFDFIIKVAEDASTDGTQKILLACRERHPGIIKLFMKGKSIGAEKNLRHVLKTVDTKYFTFLAADDVWRDKSRLQTLVDQSEAHAGFNNDLFHNSDTGTHPLFIKKVLSVLKGRSQ